MTLIDRYLPTLGWIPKAIEARMLTPHMVRSIPKQRSVVRDSPREISVLDEANIPESAVLQVQLGQKRNVRFLPIRKDTDEIPLAKNEVLFLPHTLGLNKYILYYNDGYLPMDIDTFVDPCGELNSPHFKTIPAWGLARVHRTNHPEIAEGSLYYGFWPIAPYSVRAITGVDHGARVAYHDIPRFKGVREWLKLIEADDFSLMVSEYFEYFKIGITYAREIRDFGYFGAEQLVLTSASSSSSQVIAMCVKELNPSMSIIGLTSQRSLGLVKSLPFYDDVYTYDDIEASPNAKPTLFFDVLGKEAVATECFDHFEIARWWFYGQGSERRLFQFLKKNSRGSYYTNLVDSYIYAKRHSVSDAEILSESAALNQKYDLERIWTSTARQISSTKDLYGLYQSLIHNTQPPGEKVMYRSPLHPRALPGD